MPVRAPIKNILSLCLVFMLLFGTVSAAYANAQMVDAGVEYSFGGQILFHARFQTDSPVVSAWLNIKLQNTASPVTRQILPGANGELEYSLDPNSIPLRAFSHIDYWYQLELEDGSSLETERATFYYEDNRFEWQRMESGIFRLNWYSGDEAFAHSVLEESAEGLQKVQELLPLQSPAQINIYVYPTSAEMQTTLLLSGQSWVAGHADPDLAVMVVTLPPGPEQRLEARRVIPHEIMHILLYQTIGDGYHKMPTWLNEGLSSLAELTPNPEYQKILEGQKDGLIALSALCPSFPVDSRGAGLSYAEANSFTRYLYRRFGSLGLQSLVQSYATGGDCEAAPQAALGAPLSTLDAQWQQEVFTQEPVPQPETPSAGPWVLLFGAVVFVPIMLGSAGIFARQTHPGKQINQ